MWNSFSYLCHKNRLLKIIPTYPHNLCMSFKVDFHALWSVDYQGIIGIVLMSQVSLQCQNSCWISLAFIVDGKVSRVFNRTFSILNSECWGGQDDWRLLSWDAWWPPSNLLPTSLSIRVLLQMARSWQRRQELPSTKRVLLHIRGGYLSQVVYSRSKG